MAFMAALGQLEQLQLLAGISHYVINRVLSFIALIALDVLSYVYPKRKMSCEQSTESGRFRLRY